MTINVKIDRLKAILTQAINHEQHAFFALKRAEVALQTAREAKRCAQDFRDYAYREKSRAQKQFLYIDRLNSSRIEALDAGPGYAPERLRLELESRVMRELYDSAKAVFEQVESSLAKHALVVESANTARKKASTHLAQARGDRRAIELQFQEAYPEQQYRLDSTSTES